MHMSLLHLGKDTYVSNMMAWACICQHQDHTCTHMSNICPYMMKIVTHMSVVLRYMYTLDLTYMIYVNI